MSFRSIVLVGNSSMRTIVASFLLLTFVFAASCTRSASQTSNADPATIDPILCRVDTTQEIRRIPATLFGTNLEWFNQANGIARTDGSFDPKWPQLARAEGVQHIRFPGGTLSDFYHWRDGTGPLASRPIREHPTDSGRSANAFGTPEFLRFCSAAGAEPLITVNAGTAGPDEAAAWVAYCNQPGNKERSADGLPEPANVKFWEIGNELYLPGNPTDKQLISVTPEVYAERFLAFASAMKKVDPTIKLIGIGTANAYTIALPHPDWSETVLRLAGQEMDYYSVHNSYFPMIQQPRGLDARTVYQSLWAAPEAVNDKLQSLAEFLSRLDGTHKTEIAVTEWGALFSAHPQWVDHVKTMGTSVYLARLLQVYISIPRVTLASYFKYTDRTFMGWVAYDQKPKIPYFVIQLFTQHFGDRLVKSSIENGPTYDAPVMPPIAPRKAVPEITCVASVDETGKRLYVNLINRSWETPHQIALETGQFKSASTATAWSISAASVTDHNGRDLPSEIPLAAYIEPNLSPKAKAYVGIEERSINLNQPIIVPPYSIITIEMNAIP